jgi:hypothetical protein
MTTVIIGAVQPELGLKPSMTTTIIRFHPTRIRPKTIYDDNNIGFHPTRIYGLEQSMKTTFIGLIPTLIRPKPIYDDRNYWTQCNIKWAKFNL